MVFKASSRSQAGKGAFSPLQKSLILAKESRLVAPIQFISFNGDIRRAPALQLHGIETVLAIERGPGAAHLKAIRPRREPIHQGSAHRTPFKLHHRRTAVRHGPFHGAMQCFYTCYIAAKKPQHIQAVHTVGRTPAPHDFLGEFGGRPGIRAQAADVLVHLHHHAAHRSVCQQLLAALEHGRIKAPVHPDHGRRLVATHQGRQLAGLARVETGRFFHKSRHPRPNASGCHGGDLQHTDQHKDRIGPVVFEQFEMGGKAPGNGKAISCLLQGLRLLFDQGNQRSFGQVPQNR